MFITSKQLKLILNSECGCITLISSDLLVYLGISVYVPYQVFFAVVSQIIFCLADHCSNSTVYSRDR